MANSVVNYVLDLVILCPRSSQTCPRSSHALHLLIYALRLVKYALDSVIYALDPINHAFHLFSLRGAGSFPPAGTLGRISPSMA